MMTTSELYIPQNQKLFSLSKKRIASSIENEIRHLVTQKDYPCVAAIKSYFNDEYEVGVYQKFGSGHSGPQLRQDLGNYLQKVKASQSPYYTFWAVYPDREYSESEERFENDLWKELSHTTSLELKDSDWQNGNSNLDDKNFGFHLFGESFFVVGLHPRSSRKSRIFPWPTLIFNVFSQFKILQKQGIYDSMVATNRNRDLKFQGSANPMALTHGDHWETIQFSGRNNTSEWKCPFQFLKGIFK